MLIVSPKCQESVAVGESVGTNPLLTVTVLEITGGRVRMGFGGRSRTSRSPMGGVGADQMSKTLTQVGEEVKSHPPKKRQGLPLPHDPRSS